jgi:hypothetical protein
MLTYEDLQVCRVALQVHTDFIATAERQGVLLTGQSMGVAQVKAKIEVAINGIEEDRREKAAAERAKAEKEAADKKEEPKK